jgi:Fe-S cluster biogenesis protein NfuA
MFIQTEATPNPMTLKFLPGQPVLAQGTADFRTSEEAERSPLAQRLFQVAGVTGVFLGSDFVSISKDEASDWYQMKPALLGVIMEHFTAGRPVLAEAAAEESAAEHGNAFAPEDAGIVDQIKELLDTRVRPAVAQDGGDIVFRGFERGVVYLNMRGACSGCPSSTATLKMGIENMLRHYIPEVVEVRAIT